VRRQLPGGYELDDDRSRLDITAIHAYIGGRSYWAKGRTLEQMRAVVEGSVRVIGVYHDGSQVGFARVVSDGVAFAYLADVYLLDEHRGKGIGMQLVREAVDHEDWRDMRWVLATRDAHAMYERFGFGTPSGRLMERVPG
jgi:GNAT superfamily N-acetyltransferase